MSESDMSVIIRAEVSSNNFTATVKNGMVEIRATHTNSMRINSGCMCVNDIISELMELQKGINKCR